MNIKFQFFSAFSEKNRNKPWVPPPTPHFPCFVKDQNISRIFLWVKMNEIRQLYFHLISINNRTKSLVKKSSTDYYRDICRPSPDEIFIFFLFFFCNFWWEFFSVIRCTTSWPWSRIIKKFAIKLLINIDTASSILAELGHTRELYSFSECSGF